VPATAIFGNEVATKNANFSLPGIFLLVQLSGGSPCACKTASIIAFLYAGKTARLGRRELRASPASFSSSSCLVESCSLACSSLRSSLSVTASARASRLEFLCSERVSVLDLSSACAGASPVLWNHSGKCLCRCLPRLVELFRQVLVQVPPLSCEFIPAESIVLNGGCQI